MLLWLALAHAEDPSVARMCADAAEGTEVEVCLRLAAEHPDQVNRIAAALRGRLDRGATPDRELLLALLLLLSEETGAAGAQALGELADSRATLPLVHAANTRTLPVATAAVRALARYPGELQVLEAWVIDADSRLEIRLAAVEALTEIGSESAANAVLDALRRQRLPPPLRQKLVGAVLAVWPERSTELHTRVTRDGTPWLSLAGGVGLATSMGAAGALGRTEGLRWLGVSTGAAAGATSGYLAGRAWPMEANEAAFVATTGLLGVTSGMVIGASLAPDQADDAVWYGGLAGGALGYAGGFGLRKRWQGEEYDVADAFLVSATTGLSAGAATAWAQANTGTGRPSLAIGLGMAGGTLAGLALGPNIELHGADPGFILLSAAYGAAFGGLVPIQTEQRGLLGLSTLGAGALSGYALAQTVDAEWATVAGGFTGMAFGSAFGAGTGLLLDPDSEQVVVGSALAGITAGTAAGVLLTSTDPDPIDDRDVVLTVLSTGWLSWQSFGFVALANVDDKRRLRGVALMVPALGGAAVAATSRHVDWPVTNAMGATSIGLWGAYAGGATATLLDASADNVLLASLLASDVGVLGGGLLMSPLVRTPPLVVGIADAGGVLVGSLAAMSVSFASEDSDAILLGSLIGAGAGFAGGAALGTLVHRSGATRSIALGPVFPSTVRVELAPTALSDGEALHYGLLLRVSEW